METGLFRWVTPNGLTWVRIGAIPVILILLHSGGALLNWSAFGIYAVACVTDYLDGRLARFRGEISLLGKLLDPIADKMLIAACLVMLVWQQRAPIIPVLLIVLREFAVAGLRQVAASEGIQLSVSGVARYKTTVQMLAVGFLIARYPPEGLPAAEIGLGLLWIAAVFTLWTGLEYFRAYFRELSPP